MVGGASYPTIKMPIIPSPILPQAPSGARGGIKTKTKTNKSASIVVSAGTSRVPAEVNANNKRLNREATTNTKRAGSSSHKAQNGPLDANAQAALSLKRERKNLKSKEQRLRRAQLELDELIADVNAREAEMRCAKSDVQSNSYIEEVSDDICDDSESSSVNAEEAPVQYTYATARLYTRSVTTVKSERGILYVIYILLCGGSIIICNIPALLITLAGYRAIKLFQSVAQKYAYDPKSLVVDPQNLRPHSDTVKDYSTAGDQMALIGYTSHSEVTICVEVYDHMLSRKSGMRFSERTFQNLMTEAFHAFPKPKDGTDPIPAAILENTSYVFGQYLIALQMRSKYHLPSTLEAPVPLFQKANWWNLA